MSLKQTFVYNFQTLIAGVLALIAAIWTVITTRGQIKQTERLEEERRNRQNNAARSMMPAALSELCQYAENCSAILLSIYENPPSSSNSDIPRAEFPSIPADAMLILRDCIEYGKKPVANNISALIRHLQVQNSRLSGRLWSPSSGQSIDIANILECILDAVELYARASNLFDYARQEKEGAPPPLDEGKLINAAGNCRIYQSNPNHVQIRSLIPSRINLLKRRKNL